MTCAVRAALRQRSARRHNLTIAGIVAASLATAYAAYLAVVG
jgi:hypothetical protein